MKKRKTIYEKAIEQMVSSIKSEMKKGANLETLLEYIIRGVEEDIREKLP